MDTLIISHATARLFYRACPTAHMFPRAPRHGAVLPDHAPTYASISRAQRALVAHGMDPASVFPLDVLVLSQASKRRLSRIRCYRWDKPLPPRSLFDLGEGIYVVGPELCALQAASTMEELELIEYLFELCARYTPTADGKDYIPLVRPLTTGKTIESFLRALPRTVGKARALDALRFARDRSRSPMETALTMTLTCPVRLGGLGLRDVKMDLRVAVTGDARSLTRRSSLYFDTFVERGNQNIEYQSEYHLQPQQAATDNERRHALRAMGYTMVEVSKQQFFDEMAFRRVLMAILLNAGIPASRYPDGFWEKQDGLRRFVLRRWLDEVPAQDGPKPSPEDGSSDATAGTSPGGAAGTTPETAAEAVSSAVSKTCTATGR